MYVTLLDQYFKLSAHDTAIKQGHKTFSCSFVSVVLLFYT